MRIIVFVIFILLCLHARLAIAQVYDVESSGEYVMGDSDTKLEARRLALEHAKRLAAEKIGTYLESETIVRNSRLEKDEIRSYSSAILKTTILWEGINLLSDKTTVFSIKIKASVDTKILEQKINEIKSDTKRKEQLEKLQAENIKLLKDLETISSQLRGGKANEYKQLREKRETLFARLDKTQKSISTTFEKGTLLNLALKSKNEFDELKSKVDESLKYYIDNVKYKLGEPQVINHEEVSDISINVDMWFENSNELVGLINNFSTDNSLGNQIFYGNELYIASKSFMGGARKYELASYHSECYPRLKINAGKYHAIMRLNKPASTNSNLVLRKSELMTIVIPTSELATIGSIDTEVFCEDRPFEKITSTSEEYPVKKKEEK